MNGDPHEAPLLLAAGDHALCVQFGEAIDPALNDRVLRLLHALDDERPAGVVGLQPAYSSLLVSFDPMVTDAAAVAQAVERRLGAVAPPPPGRTVQIEVCYGGEFGPDLEDVARIAGIAPDEAAGLHAAPAYRVHFLGFAPGFPYLGGMSPRLAAPRLDAPRTKVPAGSVAIAGGQTGIYPFDSPGGWRVIGRTPRRLFDAAGDPPALLQPGDTVRFVAVPPGRLAAAPAAYENGRSSTAARTGEAAGRRTLRALAPGFLTTVQDLGRAGLGRLGVSQGGAADPLALRIGNRLVGNADAAAALEMTLAGGAFEFSCDVMIALAGADQDPRLDGEPVPMWTRITVAAGQQLHCGPARDGARGYLCVAGGIDVPLVLGGRATLLGAGFGGLEGRALRRGDVVPLGPAPPRVPRRRLAPDVAAALLDRRVLRVAPGLHASWFAPEALENLARGEYEVLDASDRRGLRLRGAALAARASRQLVSVGVPLGAVQVTPDGQPIITFVDHQTTGGYPQVASVIAADLHRVGQLRPRDRVRLVPVTIDEARAALAEQERRIERDGLVPA